MRISRHGGSTSVQQQANDPQVTAAGCLGQHRPLETSSRDIRVRAKGQGLSNARIVAGAHGFKKSPGDIMIHAYRLGAVTQPATERPTASLIGRRHIDTSVPCAPYARDCGR
jgi:hypothetical protein